MAILTFPTWRLAMLSLNDLPLGLDMSRTSLTLSFWLMAMMLLALKWGKGGEGKGPARIPALTHAAMLSVISSPCSYADSAFGTDMAGSGLF